MDFETLSRWADEELQGLLKVLPPDIQEAAAKVVISMHEKPGHGACDIARAERHGIHQPFERCELLAFDLGQLLFPGQPVLL